MCFFNHEDIMDFARYKQRVCILKISEKRKLNGYRNFVYIAEYDENVGLDGRRGRSVLPR